MTKIVHVSSVHKPFDTRIYFKECRTLAAAGFDVTYIVPGGETGKVDGVSIQDVPKPRGRLHRLSRTFVHLWRAALAERADAFVIHDPELMILGLLLKARKVKVIYDVHENVPKQILVKDYLGPAFVRRVISRIVGTLERLVAFRFDGFAVAAPSIQARFPAEKTVLIRNFPQLETIDAISASMSKDSGKLVVIYPGSLSRARGIGNLVDAMALLDGRAELWLLGAWHGSGFHEECARKPGWTHTRYLGRKRFDEVIGLMKSAHIGAHLPLRSPNYTDGLAVKGFEFMACGIPFVTTDEPAKRRTFHNCALFANPGDPSDIAGKIVALFDDSVRNSLGASGRSAVESTYSWERESAKLIEFYERVTSEQDVQRGPVDHLIRPDPEGK